MKTSDIKYKNLSTDYERLYDLLKQGNVIVGFNSILFNDNRPEFSELKSYYYVAENKMFNIMGALFESDFTKDKIIKICEKYNVRYFDLIE